MKLISQAKLNFDNVDNLDNYYRLLIATIFFSYQMFRVFFSGFSHGQANIRALHRMLRGAVGEQRAGHFPRGDVGVRQQEQQKHQAQQIDALHQTHLAHARPTRPGRRGDRPAQGQSQELHGHVKRARWWGQMRCGKR